MDELRVFLKTIYEREPIDLEEAVNEVAKRTGLVKISVLKLYFMSKEKSWIDIKYENSKLYLYLKTNGLRYLKSF